MSGDDNQARLLLEAKEEYSRQLCMHSQKALYRRMRMLYDRAKLVASEADEDARILLHFQKVLETLPTADDSLVSQFREQLQRESGIDYQDDLLTAVFICHTKVLMMVRLDDKVRNVELERPSMDDFARQLLIEAGREFWKVPHLMLDVDSIARAGVRRGAEKFQFQENLRECERILNECVLQAVRVLLPVKAILQNYLPNDLGAVKEQTPREIQETARSLVRDATEPETKSEAPVPAPVIDLSASIEIPKTSSGLQELDITTSIKEDPTPIVLADAPSQTGGGLETLDLTSLPEPDAAPSSSIDGLEELKELPDLQISAPAPAPATVDIDNEFIRAGLDAIEEDATPKAEAPTTPKNKPDDDVIPMRMSFSAEPSEPLDDLKLETLGKDVVDAGELVELEL